MHSLSSLAAAMLLQLLKNAPKDVLAFYAGRFGPVAEVATKPASGRRYVRVIRDEHLSGSTGRERI